ncbi:uncharacterized protein LOC143596530 [Bidens hawaiensis]|uniref:uncharacterized protein LOC143596530 n=1 Tax=Bidens hawaiensis TaxID=980011 RepID=UPI00404A7970
MPNLRKLDISGNKLGRIENVGIWRQCHLKELIVSDNNLEGEMIENGFPQWLRTQRKLEELVLSNTSISGPLPTWLRLLPIIQYLDLSDNKLTGCLTSLPSLNEGGHELGGILVLENNLFTGLIPRCLCRWTNLGILDLSRNRLTGKIPKCLWNLRFNMLLLSSNRLSGVIPSFLGDMDPSVEWLQLNDNNFSGELPRGSRYFSYLIVFDLGENKISGKIPGWIGENIPRLSALRLHANNFSGRIPYSLCKCRQLQILDIAYNITGSIPHCFKEFDGMKEPSYMSYMTLFDYGSVTQVLKGLPLDYTTTVHFVINMDLSSNKLVGEIPEELTTLYTLVGLNLSYNCFSGGIPKNIGNMTSLFSLDFSANELPGVIPQSMASLNFLSYLNLSHNNFSGKIPTGNQLRTLIDPSIYADNPFLCGAPLPKECYPHEKPPTTTSKKKHENVNEPNKLWFYLDITCGFATGFWGIIGVLLLKKQWRHKLFMFCEESMDKIYVAVMVIELKVRRGRKVA